MTDIPPDTGSDPWRKVSGHVAVVGGSGVEVPAPGAGQRQTVLAMTKAALRCRGPIRGRVYPGISDHGQEFTGRQETAEVLDAGSSFTIPCPSSEQGRNEPTNSWRIACRQRTSLALWPQTRKVIPDHPPGTPVSHRSFFTRSAIASQPLHRRMAFVRIAGYRAGWHGSERRAQRTDFPASRSSGEPAQRVVETAPMKTGSTLT